MVLKLVVVGGAVPDVDVDLVGLRLVVVDSEGGVVVAMGFVCVVDQSLHVLP